MFAGLRRDIWYHAIEMLYALVITLAAGVALLVLLGGLALLYRRGLRDGFAFRDWRWYPSPLALLLLLPVLGILLWRFFPAFLFIPIILPFFWGRRRGVTPFFMRTYHKHRQSNGRNGHRDAVEGEYTRREEE